MDLVLNNQQRLICYKTQTNQTKPYTSKVRLQNMMGPADEVRRNVEVTFSNRLQQSVAPVLVDQKRLTCISSERSLDAV